jgi:hypothetical protein
MAVSRVPPRVAPGLWVAASLLAVALAAGAVLAWWPAEGPADRPPVAGDDSSRLHRNAEAGYEIRVPAGWSVSETGSVTRLVRRDLAAVVTVGRAPAGSLEQASNRLVGALRASYADLRVAGTEPEPIFGHRSLVVGGAAKNERGERVRFLAIVIATQEEPYAITAFVPEGVPPGLVLSQLRRIVHSFRPPVGTPG